MGGFMREWGINWGFMRYNQGKGRSDGGRRAMGQMIRSLRSDPRPLFNYKTMGFTIPNSKSVIRGTKAGLDI